MHVVMVVVAMLKKTRCERDAVSRAEGAVSGLLGDFKERVRDIAGGARYPLPLKPA